MHRSIQKILLLALSAIMIAGYFWLNQNPTNIHVVRWAMDDAIPFVPIFIIPYFIFNIIYWLSFLYAAVKDKEFNGLVTAHLLIYTISLLVYALYQTTTVRPVVTGEDIFSQLVRYTYASDQPFNLLPSLHTSSAVILAMYYIKIKNKYHVLMTIYCVVVVFSTVLVKQHHVVDVLSGLLLGVLAGLVGFHWLFRKK